MNTDMLDFFRWKTGYVAEKVQPHTVLTLLAFAIC
ncbi:hypothetical protein HCH_01290 [Hahella chejuensis KCTC 2396]|uniref:Uncharacterized protein n=1 Tax=Hahella chejuensis (strain KCTC 2396) TaxID=349521 RepID=Q2SMG6_HAHCH|nr:hypothetical protein HCH_01290 [Hahella chejuensis KCTC 2396]